MSLQCRSHSCGFVTIGEEEGTTPPPIPTSSAFFASTSLLLLFLSCSSTADNVWTNSALAAEANHVVYRSTGSNSTGSWVWSAPVIDVDLD